MDGFVEKLRAELETVQSQLKERTVEAAAAEGLVKVTVNGHQEITGIYLDPQSLYPKNQVPLQEALLEATNEAIQRSRDLLRQEIARLAGGIDPSMFPDFF